MISMLLPLMDSIINIEEKYKHAITSVTKRKERELKVHIMIGADRICWVREGLF